MKLSVKNVLDRILGTTDQQEVLFPHRLYEHLLGEEYVLTTDVHATFEGMHVPEGLLGRFTHVHCGLTRPCSGCGTSLFMEIDDQMTDWRSFVWKREFEYEKEELEDVFLIDKTEGSVQLDECLRQELILMIPEHDLCPSCEAKGKQQVSHGDTVQFPFQGIGL